MGNVVDLTDNSPIRQPTRPPNQFSSDGLDDKTLIDLADALQTKKDTVKARSTVSGASEPRAWRLSELEDDHMQEVVDLIITQPKSREPPSSPLDSRNKASKKSKQCTGFRRTSSRNQTKEASRPSMAFKPPPTIHIPDSIPNPASAMASIITSLKPRHNSKRPHQLFPFLHLPPELRNRVYSLLLTTADPIELTQARQTTQKRIEQYAKCKTAKARRYFKTIFLEILQTSKQVHLEATTILYGNNVFKFRSDHKAGYRDPKKMLPQHYLGLLKRVKVSVISREADNGQDKWVADLLNSTFSREKTRLEMFELTWYGWKKFRLTKEGVVSQALLNLDVEKVFSVKVAGDARMKTEMLEELTANVQARRVEIKRPIIEVLKNGRMIEASDEEE